MARVEVYGVRFISSTEALLILENGSSVRVPYAVGGYFLAKLDDSERAECGLKENVPMPESLPVDPHGSFFALVDRLKREGMSADAAAETALCLLGY